MMTYPVRLIPDDNDTILVTFPDFPEAATYGEDRDEALTRAVDALETIIDAYIRDRQVIPVPSQAGDAAVTLPPLLAAKVQLYREMRRQRINKTTLAQRMNVHLPQIDRLLDLKHGSKIEQLEAAARALGGQLDVILIVPDDELAVTRPMNVTRNENMASRVKPGGRRRTIRPSFGVHPGVLSAQKKATSGKRVAGGKKK